MTKQPRFWGHSDTVTAQAELFTGDDWADLGLSCAACGASMVRTPNGYAACPKGHEKLIETMVMDAPTGADEFDMWALAEGLTT